MLAMFESCRLQFVLHWLKPCIVFTLTKETWNRRNTILSAIFVNKILCYNCCFTSLTYFVHMTYKWVSLSIFLWIQSDLNLELKEGLNFNEFLWLTIFEIFQIWMLSAILGQVSPKVSLYETFPSDRSFLSNHHQTIKQ